MKVKDYLFLPTHIIDPHCHGRDRDQAHKTTLEQTLLEAKRGLISVSAFMPNTNPANTSLKETGLYHFKLKTAVEKLGIKEMQYLWFGATDDNPSKCQKALRLPWIIGLKVYPKSKSGAMVTTGTVGVSEEKNIRLAMHLAKKAGKAIAFHCDDPEIALAENYSIPAEVEYVKRILKLAGQITGVKVVICHVSCRESAELIIEARRQGTNVFIEVTPQHLWFDSDGANWNPDLDPVFYHCYNKLRSGENREFLHWLIRSENIDFIYIGSDSAPHTIQEKLEKKFGGIPSNQEMVAVICTLALQYGISDERVMNLLAFNASRFLGIGIPFTHGLYRLEKRRVTATYNNGIVENPWTGSELYFPEPQ